MIWDKTGYSYDIDVLLVHQTDVNDVLGSLSGVQKSGMSVKESYYSDSRVQAKVSTLVEQGESDGYIENARIRLILSVPSKSWSRELITGYVSDIDVSVQNGYTKRSYTIEGTMWGLLDHKMNIPVTISKGAWLVSVWSDLMKKQTRMQYSTSESQDYNFSNTIVYEPGTPLSTLLFEISSGYNRMEVDGHGVVTLKAYVAPSKKTPERFISYDDPNGLLVSSISSVDSFYEIPGRSVVTATVSDESGKSQKVIVGYYDAPSGHPTSIDSRGWLKGRTDSYNGSSETPSVSELNAQAKKIWESEQNNGVEWSASSMFADYRAGEVINLVVPDPKNGTEEIKKVLISTVSTNLESMVQELTMKEV